MEVVIVTGASKGLGAAFVEQLLSPGRRVIGIARSANDALAAAAKTRDAWLDWYLQDLADADATDALAASICAGMPRDATRYVLINNAALIEPVGSASTLAPAPVMAALAINIAAPMLFSARFLAATDHRDVDRRILNISSGSGRRPMDGNGVYSATKAALDMFTRCMKAEQLERPEGRRARVVSLAPGVIDTDMQVHARSQDPMRFPQTAYFAKMKADGVLVSPADAARKILGYLMRDDFGDTEIDDIRNV
jgi:NAD(P)-dependent dehydrogenase (short-subunit alcohol dehydrogenase family)